MKLTRLPSEHGTEVGNLAPSVFPLGHLPRKLEEGGESEFARSIFPCQQNSWSDASISRKIALPYSLPSLSAVILPSKQEPTSHMRRTRRLGL